MANARAIRAELVVDGEHYEDLVMRRVLAAKVSVWIATANLKSMLVEAPIGTRDRARGRYVSFYASLTELAARGVEARVLHASPPSRPLAAEIGKAGPHVRAGAYTEGGRSNVVLRQCPRVHLKMIAIDGRLLYLGSANLTGAGLGAKQEGRRNFEMGLLTDDESMLDRTQERFDRIWRGAECAGCKLRAVCPKPLDLTSPGSSPRTRRSPSTRPSRSSRARSS